MVTIPCSLYAQDSFIITRGFIGGDAERIGIHDLSDPGSPPELTGWGHSVFASVSWDGSKKAYLKYWPTGFYMSNIDDSDERLVYGFSVGDRLPFTFSLSPDGNQIAYVTSCCSGGIYVIDLQQESKRLIVPYGQITGNLQWTSNYWPRWSSDGTKLVFQVYSYPIVSLYMVDINGDQPPVQITFPEEDMPTGNEGNTSGDGGFDWLQNSSRVLFQRVTSQGTGSSAIVRRIIYEMDMNDENLTKKIIYDDTSPSNASSHQPLYPRWSPSGDQIAVRRVVSNTPGLYVMNSTGGGFDLVYEVPTHIPGNYVISGIERWTGPPTEKDIQVNSSSDRKNLEGKTNCNTGETIEVDGKYVPECTLRAALQTAAARGGENPITFNIPGSGPHTISLQSMLPEVPAQTLLDASTQPGFETAPLIAINGSNAISTAFTLTQDESTIRGFSIGGFTGAGITITGGSNNQLEHCFIGVAPDGVTPTPNGEGIIIHNGIGNHIGNIEGESANQISANLGNGIGITGEDSRENIVVANYIGTDITGNVPLPNQGHGIAIDNTPDNTIGSAEMKLRNLISGNQESGILITGTGATGNKVLGNYIGVNVNGTQALANGSHGIFIEEGASQTIIGGSTPTAGTSPGNVISGNTAEGIKIVASGEQPSHQNKISGNIIGLNASGNAAVPNGEVGIQVIGRATEIEIGGPTPNHGNVVSGHSIFQIELADEADNVSPASPYIANNTVGLSMSGNTTIKPISIIGIKLGGAGRIFTEIGVPDFRIEDNLVAGNDAQISIIGQLSANGEISGNTLGLFRNGGIALPDSSSIGLWIQGATHLQIGQPDNGNIIGGNIIGMLLAANFSQVTGNHIGVNAAGNLARANTIGVLIPGEIKEGSNTLVTPTGMSNIIGIQLDEEGNIVEGRNIISGNKGVGITIRPDFGGTPSDAGDKNLKHADPVSMKLPETGLKALEVKYLKDNNFAPADSNIIGGNYIGLSASGGSLGNGKSNIEDERWGGVEINRGRGNYIIQNHIGDNGIGVAVYHHPDFLFGPGNTYISGNTIGTRMSGANMMPRPNQNFGIVHQASSHLYIGINPDNPLMLNPNIIAQNNNYGVFINRYTDSEAGESNVSLRGNVIASNKKGAYLIASSLENTGGDLDGVPYPPELLLIAVDSARVKISGSAPEPGQVDFYTGVPDHYGEEVISSRYYKKTIALAGTTQFALSESLDTLSLKEGDYVSATLNVAPQDGFYMTSHFSPAIRVAKADNVVEALLSEGDASELLARLGITTGRDESEEPQDDEKEGDDTSAILYATLHELAPEFNAFAGEAISAGGSHYAAPDTLMASHYWTLAVNDQTTNDFYVCLDISAIDLQALFAPSGSGHPEGRSASELLVLQRNHAGAPWQARDTYFNTDSTAICARNLYPKGDFAIGFNAAGEVTSKARFTVIFEVSDQQTNPIEGAIITLAQQQNPTGGYEFPEVPSGNYEYLVRANGFFDSTGSFTVARQDTTIQVVMATDNTSIVSLKEDGFHIFPNPNSGHFTLKWGDLQPEVVTIFDMQGRQVYQQSITSNEQQTQLTIQQASTGIYIVQIRTATSIIQRQLMIR